MKYTTDYLSEIIETGLKSLTYPEGTPRLFEPIKYSLEGGGKRLRPTLLLASYAALSGNAPELALNQALGIELFHNFTLLHDDVMDSAEIRRGRPTVHVRWNDNTAILSGDAMLTLASQTVALCGDSKLRPIMDIFNRTAMEVYQGQQLDMEFEKRQDVSVSQYLEMIRLKTSVLLACACAMGAILADTDILTMTKMYEYGLNLGIAFQLRDDWLDTYGDAAVFGKTIGGDIINRKKTWLLITALEESHGRLADILNEDLDEDETIRQVRRVYDSLLLSERCTQIAESYTQRAIEALGCLDMNPESRTFFNELALKASTRNH